jgi:predicted double-glycine peptidase
MPALALGSPHPKLPDNILYVPQLEQETDYSCGAAALLSVLKYWNVYDGDEKSLYPLLQTTEKDGTEPPMIAQVATHFGLKAEMLENQKLSDLRHALHDHKTVIVSLQAWPDKTTTDPAKISWKDEWNQGHYNVLVGMDHDYAYFMDSAAENRYAYVSLDDLLDRWHDFEDRHGYVWRFQHLAIYISGNHATDFEPISRKLTRLE